VGDAERNVRKSLGDLFGWGKKSTPKPRPKTTRSRGTAPPPPSLKGGREVLKKHQAKKKAASASKPRAVKKVDSRAGYRKRQTAKIQKRQGISRSQAMSVAKSRAKKKYGK
jgi:hypothetical protein